jgi:ABC-type nitrate/sulfonate/bicarbonate transport system substrate-binding protein
VNGDLTPAAYKFTVDLLLRLGYLKEAIPAEQLFDARFLDRALKELGRL